MKLLQRVASAATGTQLMQQRVALLEDTPVPRHVRGGLRVRLREDDVEKARGALRTAAHEREILGPEEHDRADAEDRSRRARLAVDDVPIGRRAPDARSR